MMNFLSLENTLLKLQSSKNLAKVAIGKIALESLVRGGGKYGAEAFDLLQKDLRYYKQKSVELQFELSKKEKQVKPRLDGELFTPRKQRTELWEQYHDDPLSRVAAARNHPYYAKKIYSVRNRSLVYHCVEAWLDLSRIVNYSEQEESLLCELYFNKWKLKSKYKIQVKEVDPDLCSRIFDKVWEVRKGRLKQEKVYPSVSFDHTDWTAQEQVSAGEGVF